MGTRSAPLVFLLLAACMTGTGTPPGTQAGNVAKQDRMATAVARPAALPAIPRMRPGNVPRKEQSARAPVRTDAVPTARQKIGEKPAGKPLPAGGSDRNDQTAPPGNASGNARNPEAGDGAETSAGTNSQLRADAPPAGAPGSPATGVGSEPLPGADGPLADNGANSDSGMLPDLANEPIPGSGKDISSIDPEVSFDDEIDLAVLPLPEEDRGIDVESLFDGDVVRYCAAMWQMGEYIGAARRRGEPFKQAIGDAVRRIADEKQLPLDNRLAFSGQVYGRLVYRLEDNHAALTFGTYVHFACLTVRGDKKIVPADPDAERLLNSGLALCESSAFTRDDLNACIFRELTPIVDRRNG